MSESHRILILEDDPSFAQRLSRNLSSDDLQADRAENGKEGLERAAAQRYDAVLCDIKMPVMGGLQFLQAVREGQDPAIDRDLPIVMLTSITNVKTAVEAMQLGASDYLTKESSRTEIAMRLRKAIEQRALREENTRLRETIARTGEFDELIGTSEPIQTIKSHMSQAGPTDASVLLQGETGVGKELVARGIHNASGRSGPFIDINGALLPDDNSIQSELFGHEKGAFTGAHQLKKGKLELADGGTLFIDEIGEVSLAVQAKLLRVLETMEFVRMGGTRPIKVNVRIVAATNRDLLAASNAGEFRSDLYYRLSVYPIAIPPLRERREDVLPLTQYFLKRFADKYGRPAPFIETGAMEKLRSYHWPGNIRELRNVCERLVIRAAGSDSITAAQVAACGLSPAPERSASILIPDEGVDLDEMEKQMVLEALRKTDWNQTEAARLLNISVDRMNNRVKKWSLKHDNWRVNKE